MKIRSLTIAFGALLISGVAARAQTINNGSFELPALGATPFTALIQDWGGAPGSSAGVSQNVAGGFSVTGGAASGLQYAYLQGANSGIFNNQVNLTASTQYTLNYSVAGRLNGGGNTTYQVLLNNSTLLASGSTTTGMAFTNNSLNFVATNTGLQEIRFVVTGTGGDPNPDQTMLLDLVTILSNGPVPEPGALALLALSLPAAGLVLRRRRTS
jgi:hypothetical protein